MSVFIDDVEKGSAAQKAGIKAGDTLVLVNGQPIFDMLDYRFYCEENHLVLQLQDREVVVYKKDFEPLGLLFSSYLIEERHRCKNNCIFCFIDQNPKNLRETLYFKDDDERLSFLFGNYITLTNLTEQLVLRIIKQRISPLNISLHTANPTLRAKMMGNKKAGDCISLLQRFAQNGISMNLQLVLCSGINDGEELAFTLDFLANLYPMVQSVCAVPAGLTAFREGLFPLTSYTQKTAEQTLNILDTYGERNIKSFGKRCIYAADEFFLLAKSSIPPYEYYDDFLQYENGAGMWRSLHDEFILELQNNTFATKASCDIVTGEAAAGLIQTLCARYCEEYGGTITVHVVKNNFFGGAITVTGLVVATDIIEQCRGKMLSKTLLLPKNMLRSEGDVFLDNISHIQLADELKVRIKIVPVDGAELFFALKGE